MKPSIGDVIELISDVPDRNLRAGAQGTVVHCHSDRAYEVEFADAEGETLDFLALRPEQFMVVWRAETQQWVSLAEQAAALVANLPAEAGREVLDFARFLSVQTRQTSSNHAKVTRLPRAQLQPSKA
jgi:hypothetical protein